MATLVTAAFEGEAAVTPGHGPDIPLPMSFPNILRDPRNRFAHLHGAAPKPHVHGMSRTEYIIGSSRIEGKRKALRKENSGFSFNPHAVPPQRSDYDAPRASVRSTFPVPLPPYLPRSQLAPSPVAPQRDEYTAAAGRFSMSLRGVRKDLRRRGLHAEKLVRVVEAEIVRWLQTPGQRYPDRPLGVALVVPIDQAYNGCIGGVVIEVYRTPLKLVWRTDDAMARYAIHCTARWHSVVSFSKDMPNGERHTTMLRPNVFVPDMPTVEISVAAATFLATPIMDTDTDALSSAYDSEAWSHVERPTRGGPASVTSDVITDITDDMGATEMSSGDESSLYEAASSVDMTMASDNEGSLAEYIEDSSMGDDDTPRPADLARSLNRMNLADRQNLRSRSSPSPSPVRRRPAGRSAVEDRARRGRQSSPTGRGPLPELERRRPGRPPARAQSFWDHVFQ